MIKGSNYIFVQVPRTSSSSISHVLMTEAGGSDLGLHTAFADSQRRPCITNRFVFGFVRNPWDREYSQWKYHAHKSSDVLIKPTFEEWVLWRYSDLKLPAGTFKNADTEWYLKTFSVLPQLGFLMDQDGDLQTNFIGRFETRQEDTDFVLNRLGIEYDTFPRIEAGYALDEGFQTVYTEETRDLVAEKMMPDIEVFNYTFCQKECHERRPSLELLTDYSFLERGHPRYGYLHGG